VTSDERDSLRALIRTGTHASRTITRARVLITADEGFTDDDNADANDRSTVIRVGKRFATEGLESALRERPRSGAPRKLSTPDEALLAATACDVAAGRARDDLRIGTHAVSVVPPLTAIAVTLRVRRVEGEHVRHRSKCRRGDTPGISIWQTLRVGCQKFAVTLLALGACSSHSEGDASIDVSMADTLEVVAPDTTAWTLEGNVIDEVDAPLEGVSVRAERGDVFLETTTDASGHFRFEVDDQGAWDVTAAAPGRTVLSWIGVDGPLTQPLRLPVASSPVHVPFSGTAPPVAPGHSGIIGAIGGEIDDLNGASFSGHYDYIPDAVPPYPDVRVLMLETDPLRHLSNAGLSAPFPRNGRPITDIEFALPAVPPPIRQIDVTLRLPNAGLLSSESVITDFHAAPLQTGPRWSAPVGQGLVDGPYDGVAHVHYEYVDGELAPDHFVINATFIRTHAVFSSIARRSISDGEVITLPILRVLQVDGSTLGDATFSADATPGGAIAVRVVDPTLGVAWLALAYHPERPFFRRLPALPTSVALSSVTSGDTLTVGIFSVRDPLLPDRLDITAFGSLLVSLSALRPEWR
jgi:hypothetical protein